MDHSFDLAVAPATILDDLSSDDFLHAFSAEVGVEVDELTCGTDGDRATATMLWRFSTAKPGIPALAQRMLPGEVRLSWLQGWGPLTEDGSHGTLEVNLLGTPKATSTGKARLTPSDLGTTLATSTKTKASLPFPIAGKVQSMVDKDLVGWILSVQARVLARRHPN